MSNFQALVLGMMVAWTPSMIVLAYLLRRAPLIDYKDDSVSSSQRMDLKAGMTSPLAPLDRFDPVET
jgi:hypothetical protein